jgi:hypothetical protein
MPASSPAKPPETTTYYLLACLECDAQSRPLLMPFGTAAERGKWAAEHTRGTGHDRWYVTQETR